MSSRQPLERLIGASLPLWRRLKSGPRVDDRGKVHRRLADLAANLTDQKSRDLLGHPRVRSLIGAIADHSPYLWHLIERDRDRFFRVLLNDPDDRIAAVMTEVCARRNDDEDAVMTRLRLAKQEVALLTAFADLGGVWSLSEVVQRLSRVADDFIAVALTHLLREAHRAGRLRLPSGENPQVGCGMVVLGLGKLGGHELNYSSDVDLVVVYDPQGPAAAKPDNAKQIYVRIVQDLVKMLQQPTAHGYVLRVDLRLRPDPGSTAVAIGLNAASTYYESFGQTWERAAWIKARPVAGDLVLGETFIRGLSPFIWRKYFDYGAISEIHAMKRRIYDNKGHSEIAVTGHDVKLGRGGIRDIEFFVQAQQLIFGGKRIDLRGAQTLPMLGQLRRDGWIGAGAVGDLTRAYKFLRRVEHRLQMVADEQTHRLPRASAALERFSRFCGFASADRFAAVLQRHLRAVVRHYGRLFEQISDVGEAGNSLVFSGIDDDPGTIEVLRSFGFRRPEAVAQTIREWHAGRRSALRSQRAREALVRLVPKLLTTFSRVSDPDGAVADFDQALDRMAAAGELFAILSANAALRALFGDILGGAPRLAAAVVLYPHLLDGIIDPERPLCLDEDGMEARATSVLSRSRSTEDFLDSIRDFRREEHFLIGVAVLSGNLAPDEAGLAYSALAVGILRVVVRQLRKDFSREHGLLEGGAMAVLAMGKLGSEEMTATSDLDLVLLYAFDDERPESDGSRPLHALQYFARLTKRLISHLTVATRRGTLYEVDMRLRPSGRQGPLATKLSAFAAYQRDEAATWEHMALSRARCVAGDAALVRAATAEIRAVLRLPPSPSLRRDVADMRARIDREKPPNGEWDLKLLPGGLLDIEFLAQYLLLRNAHTTDEVIDTSTVRILKNCRRLGVIDVAMADRLIEAHRLLTSLTQTMRMALEDSRDLDGGGEGLKHRLAAATNMPDIIRLVGAIETSRQAVREIFRETLSVG